jgi:hypothetical protein
MRWHYLFKAVCSNIDDLNGWVLGYAAGHGVNQSGLAIWSISS